MQPNNSELQLAIQWLDQDIMLIKALMSPARSRFNPAVVALLTYRDEFARIRAARLRESDKNLTDLTPTEKEK